MMLDCKKGNKNMKYNMIICNGQDTHAVWMYYINE